MPERVARGKRETAEPGREMVMAHRPLDLPPVCRAAFVRVVGQPDEQIDLAEASLLIAKEEYPELDVAAYLERLDAMGREARARLAGQETPRDVIGALNAYLFGSEGFRGNTQDYYDPRNSFLNEVLDRRIGIPLTLSVIYMEVGRRAGVPVRGIGMPGHFLVKHAVAGQQLLIDPFNAGTILLPEDCQALLDRIFAGEVAYEPRYLEPVGSRQILTRMLQNLKVIYFNSREYRKAVSVVDRLLVLHPGCAAEVRDRGLLLSQLKAYAAAMRDLERYLRMSPGAEDSDVIRGHLRSLRQRVVVLN
jgi:regulator of sirC expression with transglutaminase-like and TPR domain